MKKTIAALFALFAVPLILTSCSGKSGGEVTDTRQSSLFDDGGADETVSDIFDRTEPSPVPSGDTTAATDTGSTDNDEKNTNLSQALSDIASDIREDLTD